MLYHAVTEFTQSQHTRLPTVMVGRESTPYPSHFLLACPVYGERRDDPTASCLWVFCLVSLNPRVYQMLRLRAPHSPMQLSSLLSTPTATLKLSGVGNVHFSLWKYPQITRTQQEPPQALLVPKWCLLPISCLVCAQELLQL